MSLITLNHTSVHGRGQASVEHRRGGRRFKNEPAAREEALRDGRARGEIIGQET